MRDDDRFAYIRERMRALANAMPTMVDAIRGAAEVGNIFSSKRLAERDLTRSIAHQVGLTDEQAHEVIDAWDAHYRTLPLNVNEHVIRDACVLRALGDEWRPSEMPRDWRLR